MATNVFGRARLTTGLALAASLVVGTTGTAYAASVTTEDPTGDVVTYQRDGTTTPRPGATKVDLVSARYDYRRQYLVVVATALDAGRRVQPLVTVAGGSTHRTYVGTPSGRLSGDFAVQQPPCAGGRSTTNLEAHTYRMRIPASCLGSPGQARVRLSLIREETAAYALTSDEAQDGAYTAPLTRG